MRLSTCPKEGLRSTHDSRPTPQDLVHYPHIPHTALKLFWNGHAIVLYAAFFEIIGKAQHQVAFQHIGAGILDIVVAGATG